MLLCSPGGVMCQFLSRLMVDQGISPSDPHANFAAGTGSVSSTTTTGGGTGDATVPSVAAEDADTSCAGREGTGIYAATAPAAAKRSTTVPASRTCRRSPAAPAAIFRQRRSAALVPGVGSTESRSKKATSSSTAAPRARSAGRTDASPCSQQ